MAKKIPETNLDSKLDTLLQQRQHGAIALSGFRFQLLYSLWRAFDLFDGNGEVSQIRFEGIEDIDLYGDQKVFIQVKSSINNQGWGWINSERILDKFLEVYQIDSNTQFRLVTDFELTGDLALLAKIAGSPNQAIPPKLGNRLSLIAKRCDFPETDIALFVQNLSFEHTQEASLKEGIRKAIIQHLSVTSGNEDLYFLTLFAGIIDYAVNRKLLDRSIIEGTYLQLQDLISMGPVNPAIQQGWIERLQFEEESRVLDYYSGKSARPAHILNDLDARRPTWLAQIDQSLKDTPVCAIRASSGQGKSTLLLRYAFEHYHPDTVFILRHLPDTSVLQPIIRFLKSRLVLGLPILVLVDNLTESVQAWQELARELAGESVSFLLASREENWFRYSGDLSGITWASVFPELSFEEAKDIYAQFLQRNRIAPNVKSAAWAYEQVADRKLLIEFVYLITHGQMLSERLSEQIKSIHLTGEDPAKLAVLRVVSLAQIYDVRVQYDRVVDQFEFRDDPQLTLNSLIGEYLLREGIYLDGLHYVRSEHLINLLHDNQDVTRTLVQLIDLVSDEDIENLVQSCFSPTWVKVDRKRLLGKLCERTTANIPIILDTTEALFEADERNYVLANRDHFDAIYKLSGSSGQYLIVSNTLPCTKLDIFDRLIELFGDKNENLVKGKQVVEAFSRRGELEERYSQVYLKEMLKTLTPKQLLENLVNASRLRAWVSFFDQHEQSSIEFSAFDNLVAQHGWENLVLSQAIRESASFLGVLYYNYPDSYDVFMKANKVEIFLIFQIGTYTLKLEEQQEDIFLEFVVDEHPGADTPNEQVMSRIDLLRECFPHYEHYKSSGLFPSALSSRVEPNDTLKRIPKENLQYSFFSDLNAIYGNVVNQFYSAELLHDWLEHWTNARQATLDLIQGVSQQYEDILRGRKPGVVQHQLMRVSSLHRRELELPPRIRERFNNEQKAVKAWHTEVSKFLNTHFSLNDDNPERSKRLSVMNLRSASVSLVPMQNALSTIIQAEGGYFEASSIESDEIQSYSYCADLMEYWLETSADRRLNPKVRPRDAIDTWKRRQNRELRDNLRNCFQPLVEDGWRVFLPKGFYDEPPQKNLCLGFQLVDATEVLGHLWLFFSHLAQTDLAYDFVYAMPLLRNGTPYSGYTYFASRDTVQKLSDLTIQPDKVKVFPVKTPPEFFELVDDIQPAPITEWKLFESAISSFGSLLMLRNEHFYIGTRLQEEKFESFRSQLENNIQRRLESVDADAVALLERANEFYVEEPNTKWAELWKYFEDRLTELKGQVFDGSLLEAIPIDDDPYLMRLYGEYINSRME